MFLLKLFSKLPFPVLYFISDLLFYISFYLVRYRRKLVRKNLAHSFPEKTKSERQRIEKEFFRNLCDYAVESLKLLTISREELARRMVYRDFRLISGYQAKHQSVIMLASHTFNWEWLLAAGTLYLPVAVDFVYQPQNNRAVDRFSRITRTRFGAYPIPREKVARESFKRKDILRGIAIVADQYPGLKKDKKYITQFLNQKTAFFYGANQLAVLMQYPVIYAEVRKIKRGYYETVLVRISEPPYDQQSEAILSNYVPAVEKLIRERPSEWLWSHNRWKKRHLRQASVQYPPGSTGS
jgi:KDO2-lipid IV(A) lauroyltransferase